MHNFSQRVVIFGDSFISRLVTYMRNNEGRAETESVDPSLYGRMGLEDCDLHVWGHERMKASTLVQQYQEQSLDFLEGFRPEIAIMHLGGNDLYDNPTDPEATVKSIQELIQMLRFDFQIQKVIVCPLLPRTFPARKAHQYMAALDRVNQDIKELCAATKDCEYWSHRGCLRLWNADLYAKDGVNLDSKGPAKKIFCRSIREAVLRAKVSAF